MTGPAATYHWYPGEMEVWRQKEPLNVSQFATKYRKVTLGAHRGDWDNSVTPYLVKIMDTYNLPWVQDIVIKGVPQSGKTNAWINMHLFAIYYRGGNVKYVMLPKEALATKISKDRLIPIYRMCEPIAKKLSANPDDTASKRIAFRDGTVVYPIWGSSPAEISSFPSDDTVADETDKNDDLAGKETNALTLLEKRTTTFRRPKRIKCSSPGAADSLIDKAFEDCVEQNDYRVKCPHCGEPQKMKETNLIYPGQMTLDGKRVEADPKQVMNDKLARYRCEGCAVLWTDLDRDRAVRLGDWFPRQQVDRPMSVGFEIDAFICPDISLSEYAAAIIKANSGDLSSQIDLDNAYRAKKYEPERKDRKEDHILARRDEHLPRGVVPQDSSCIILSADTQQNGFYYQFIAFGWGMPLQPTMIDHGFVESFDSLKLLAARDFDMQGTTQKGRAVAAFIDSGGGTNPFKPKHSRTREVYDFCILNPFFRPVKGARTMQSPWSVSHVEFYPSQEGKKIPLPVMLNLYRVNVTIYKDELSGKLNINPGDPGALRLHAGSEAEFKGYSAQMCAEYRDDRGYWECPKNKDNHHWDVSVYALAGADILQVKLWSKPDAQQPNQQGRKVRSSGM